MTENATSTTKETAATKKKASMDAVEDILKWYFIQPDILWEALQAPGSGATISGDRTITSEGNKRLALVGEAWMKLMILRDWYSEGTPREHANNAMQNVTNGRLLERCRELGIHQYINLNPSSRIPGDRTMIDTMQAIIGAAGEEGSSKAVRFVMNKLNLPVKTDSNDGGDVPQS